MINIEKNVETALYKSAYQGLRIEFEPLRGKKFHITSLDLVEGSFQIKMTSTSTNNMQIGNMSANDLSMELMNPTDSWGIGKFDDVYFCGATIRPYLLVYDQTQDKMIETPFGVYIIDNQPRALDTIKITAFNNVIRLDTPFKAEGLAGNFMNLRKLVEKGLEKAGLKHDGSIDVFPPKPHQIQTYSIDVTKIKSEQTITWRQVIKWCCECVGVNAISDEKGIIKFVFYDKYTPDVLRDEDDLNLVTEDGEILLIDDTPTTDFQLTPALRYADNSSEIAEEDVVITGFQFKVDDMLYPNNAVMDYGLISENNLVFYALNEDGRKTMAETVNAKLAGFTYRPFKCNTLSFPHLQTFDSVVYIKDGKRYHSIITDIVYKLNGDMTLTAKGKNKEQKAWEVLGALTPKQQAIIDSVSRKVDNTREQLSSYENALLLFNEKILHSMGLYKTVKDDPNGGIITYFHNMETLENSDTIYMFGASGFAWTTDGWKDGNPVWHYGFTSTGDAIFSEVQAYKISADLIQTGYLRSQNGASEINMENGSFFFGRDANHPTLKLEDDGTLSVYGIIRNGAYSNFSASVGPSERGDSGAFTVTDSTGGYGNLFQVYGVKSGSDKGTVWTAPFLLNSEKTNRKGIAILPHDISIFNDNYGNQSAVCCGEDEAYLTNGHSTLKLEKDLDGINRAYLTTGTSYITAYKGDIQLSTYSHSYVWINYYKPKYGLQPTAYKFGDGTGGGFGEVVARNYLMSSGKDDFYFAFLSEDDEICIRCADINCSGQIVGGNTFVDYIESNGNGYFSGNGTFNGKVAVGGNTFWGNHALNVTGTAIASTWAIKSSRELKENVVELKEMNALDKILDLNFYSYDFKKEYVRDKVNDTDSPVHIPCGIMWDEAPAEIKIENGEGIDLYSYISVTAKAVQELSDICKAQMQKNIELEQRLEAIEKILLNNSK